MKQNTPTRAPNADKPRVHVQAKVRQETFEIIEKAQKKHKCSVSEAIDILLYDLSQK